MKGPADSSETPRRGYLFVSVRLLKLEQREEAGGRAHQWGPPYLPWVILEVAETALLAFFFFFLAADSQKTCTCIKKKIKNYIFSFSFQFIRRHRSPQKVAASLRFKAVNQIRFEKLRARDAMFSRDEFRRTDRRHLRSERRDIWPTPSNDWTGSYCWRMNSGSCSVVSATSAVLSEEDNISSLTHTKGFFSTSDVLNRQWKKSGWL